MPKVLRLAAREYKAAVRTRGFIIGLVLFPVLMGGSGIAMALLKDRVDTSDKTVAVLDRSGLLADYLMEAATRHNAEEIANPATGARIKAAYFFEILTPAEGDPDLQRLTLSDRVRAGELQAFLEIGAGVLDPRENPAQGSIAYYGENAAVDELRTWLGETINARLRQLRMEKANLDAAIVNEILDWRAVDGLGLVSRDPVTGEIRPARKSSEGEAIIVPLVMTMLMWMMFYIGSFPLLNAVMEEKSQRIAELMLGSVKPFEFMLGKLLGGIAVSLTAAAVYLLGGIVAINYYGYAQFIPYHVLPWFLTFMVLSVVMVGAVMAGIGAACNDTKEAQSMIMPVLIPVLIPLFVMMPVIQAPNSGFATGLSFVPSCTPMMMVMRMSTPVAVPAWQPWLGLAVVIAFTVFAVWVGGRIFRMGLLMQGQTPTLGKLFRWALRG